MIDCTTSESVRRTVARARRSNDAENQTGGRKRHNDPPECRHRRPHHAAARAGHRHPPGAASGVQRRDSATPGTTPIARSCRRRATGSSARAITIATSVTIGAPTHIGHVRNAATPADGEKHHRCSRRCRIPYDDRPPHRHRKEFGRGLCEKRIVQKRSGDVDLRHKREHDGRERERDPRWHVRQGAQRDQEDDDALQCDGERHDRIDRVQAVAPGPRSRERRQQVQPWRVMRHLAHGIHEACASGSCQCRSR